jgi:hypothetical protein
VLARHGSTLHVAEDEAIEARGRQGTVPLLQFKASPEVPIDSSFLSIWVWR